MPQLNSNIILSGRAPNVGNALMTGIRAAGMDNAVQKENRLAQIYRDNGAGIMSGDRNALNALAQVDPTQAMGIQNTQHSMDNDDERLGILRANSRRQAAIYAANLSATEAAEQLKAVEDGLKGAAVFHANGDEAGYNKWLADNELDPAEYDFANFPAHAASLGGVWDALKEATDREAPRERTKTKLADGRYYWDDSLDGSKGPTNPQLVAPDITPKDDKPLVTINNGDVTDKFYENLDKGLAGTFQGMLDTGAAAQTSLGQIDRLESLLASAPSGAEGALKKWAGEWGINAEGLDDIQSVVALINRMVPKQREPGSGPMSDADLELFKQSLPRLINQPGGNAKIVNTMRAIAEYDLQRGKIARDVATRRLTPQEGLDAIYELQNPINFIGDTGTTSTPAPATFSSNPNIAAAAKRAGVTIDEMWAAADDATRKKYSGE